LGSRSAETNLGAAGLIARATGLQADMLVVQNEQEAFTAMISLKTGADSFSDALIGALGAWAGCSATLTFDKKARLLKQFKLL
jgi:predicted nucleic-acid-binding protein